MTEPHPHNDRLSHAQCMTRATALHNDVSVQRDKLLLVLEKWNDFMRLNYTEADISWWRETQDVIRECRR